MRVLGLVLIALSLALATPAQAQPLGIQNPTEATPVTLHMHLLDVQDFPINTQEPDDRFTIAIGTALAGHSLSCVPNPPSSSVFQDFHTYYGYSSASYVEYDRTENGKPRTHPERGLGDDIRFDAQAPMTLHWYLETGAGPSPASAIPQVVPGVVVEATLRASDGISVDDAAYDTGAVIAHGRSPPALLAADATQGAEHSMVDGRHVYGIAVPLTVEGIVPKETGYTLRIDVFLDGPVCSDPAQGTAMTNNVRPYTGPQHRPRIEAAAEPQLRIDRLEPRFGPNGTVEVVANLTGAWGAYDIDEGNVTLSVDGPGGHIELEPTSVIQRTVEYGHVTEPVVVTWSFDAAGAETGLYHATFNATNDQHTASAQAIAAFRLGPDAVYPVRLGEAAPEPLSGQQAMPAPTPVLLVALLLVAVAATRQFGNR